MLATAIAVETHYYYGDVVMASADGKIQYGETSSLVERRLDEANGKIVETVLQPPRDPNQIPKDIVTTLTRVGDSKVFDAVDDENSFSGELTFAGAGWSGDTWTYAIRLNDGSRLEGRGTLSPDALTTAKLFFDAKGVATVCLRENLKAISRDRYEQLHEQLLGETQTGK